MAQNFPVVSVPALTHQKAPHSTVPYLASISQSTTEELKAQLARLRFARDLSFPIRFGGLAGLTGTKESGESQARRKAAQEADEIILLRMQAIRAELASR